MSAARNNNNRDRDKDEEERLAASVDEFRRAVGEQFADISRQNAQTSVLLERLSNRLDAHEYRLKVQENNPSNLRNWAGLWLMVGGIGLSALCGGSGLVISFANLIIAHWH